MQKPLAVSGGVSDVVDESSDRTLPEEECTGSFGLDPNSGERDAQFSKTGNLDRGISSHRVGTGQAGDDFSSDIDPHETRLDLGAGGIPFDFPIRGENEAAQIQGDLQLIIVLSDIGGTGPFGGCDVPDPREVTRRSGGCTGIVRLNDHLRRLRINRHSTK